MPGRGKYQRKTRTPDWKNDPREDESLRTAWAYTNGSITRVGRMLGLSHGQIIGRSRTIGLHVTKFKPRALASNNPAVIEGRSEFQNKVRVPRDDDRVLKPGRNSTKLGNKVTKGKWKGMPIYALTMEERATCPRDCKLWRSCYGNHMQYAVRFRHGPELVAKLEEELDELQYGHPRGFVVRLHVLGDFYSVEYVEQWAYWLTQFKALRVFGYTAWQADTPIGDAVALYRDHWWPRFAIRTSGATSGPRTSVIPAGLLEATVDRDAIPCPAQTNRTANCGTCALCWGTKRPIVFLEH